MSTFFYSQSSGGDSSDANIFLSNLAAPTAINQSLLPQASFTIDLGRSDLSLTNVFAQNFVGPSDRITTLSGDYELDISSANGEIKINPGVNKFLSLGDSTETTGSEIRVYRSQTAIALNSSGQSDGNIFLYGNYVELSNQGIGTSPQFAFFDGNDNHAVTIETPVAVTANYTLILPTAQATGVQFLQNDGAGNLSWASGGGPTYATSSVIFPDDNNYVPFALRRVGDMIFLNLELFAFTNMAGTGDADISVNGIAGLVPSGFGPSFSTDSVQIPINYKQSGIDKVGLVFIDGAAGHKVYFYKDLDFGFFAAGDTITSLTMLEGSWITPDAAP